uniref:Protein kinase domain-containing protein n=1 Tax=Strongyloides venezuelensis TaxID=75913 RepID=A0A0K0ETW5_STRVS
MYFLKTNKILFFHVIITIDCDFCKFKVLKLLGQGGFGAVYLVEKIIKKSKYAVKTELMPDKKDKFEPRFFQMKITTALQ